MELVSVSYAEQRKRFFERRIKQCVDLIQAIQSNSQISETQKYCECSDVGMEMSFYKDALRNIEQWEEFRNHMKDLHEMQYEGCRGCERFAMDCRKCMQDYYWDNIHCYLVEE